MTTPSFSREALVSASTQLISADIAGEVLILDLRDGSYFRLQGVGVRVWELLTEPRTIAELEDTLLNDYEVQSDRCRSDLDALLRGLAERRLIEIGHDRGGQT